MEPSYDRFSCGVTPRTPSEVGNCAGCGGTMYDYEVIKCGACEAQVHEGCIEVCEGEGCGQIGCRACLTENDEGLLMCEDCLAADKLAKSQSGLTKAVMRRLGKGGS
jgi:hypothetical protein